MIELQNVQIKYQDFIAVDTINLLIKEGDFFTLLGPSGCGKTTTLRAIAGLTNPNKGQILLQGQDITNVPAEKRNIGMVFQSYALFPTMTAFDNIAYGLRVERKPEKIIKELVHQQAEIVELNEKQLSKNISQLSGGQQQRVAIARTLIKEPRLILFDEPLSNLDAKLRKQLRNELKEIQAKTGLTAVYVTHDQEEALELSDQIAVFNNGKIEQIGSPFEVYNQSKTEFVCNFIGEVNQLTPTLVNQLNHSFSPMIPEKNIAYIRLEHIHSQKLREDDIELIGEIHQQKFQGNSFIYTVLVKGEKIKFIELNHSSNNYQVGDKLSLYLNRDDVLYYPIGGN
ncbi:ABC transporter ATP-binding protein [Facklamia sp. DSM 111018]|uniref:ABC transporter ATP-binding protein n=1 Tax=Facklamia lactis TaxID=2749967 RepID=A0ABS0LS22_9LACT|nr:ABC transporter ATP-binding protein [Facklamia lactis]MBG9986059.1 ABC transporter ATP-binding protein [Facklamia lactis]